MPYGLEASRLDQAGASAVTEGGKPKMYRKLTAEDDLGKLGLSRRAYNALRHAGVTSIGQLVLLAESREILGIRNIGVKSLKEIERCLTDVCLVDGPQDIASGKSILADSSGPKEVPAPQIVEVPVISAEVIKWQLGLIRRHISLGLLHEQATIMGRPISEWLSSAKAAGCF